MLEEYKSHINERAQLGIPPKTLNAEQTQSLLSLLEGQYDGNYQEIISLLVHNVAPGVDPAAKIKAEFLEKIAKEKITKYGLAPKEAVCILGTMQGGYNIQPLIDLLDDSELATDAADALSDSILIFDKFADVERKARDGNKYAAQVINSWASASWFCTKKRCGLGKTAANSAACCRDNFAAEMPK